MPFGAYGQITRSLSVGDTHEEVRALQQLLNSDPRTAVASSGVGSKGQETSYFGNLTKQAVMRFQALYANEVLSPAGISTPTGFVGIFTQKKLNTLFNANAVSTTSNNSVNTNPNSLSQIPVVLPKEESSSSMSLLFAVKPKVYALSLYVAKPGEFIEIYGTGFESKNTISFSGKEVEGVSKDGAVIRVMVPNDLPLGSYNVSVINSKGTSYQVSHGDYFVVSNETKRRPEVISISPQTVKLSDTQKQIIVVFKSEGNNTTLGTSIGESSSLTKKGDTFTFTLESLSGFANLKSSLDKNETVTFPLAVYVKDEYGFSPNPVMLYIQK